MIKTNEEIAILIEDITNDNNFSLSLDEHITNIGKTIEELKILYTKQPVKNIMDAKIYLSMAENILNNLRATIN